MKIDRDIGPCGKSCRTCKAPEACCITLEQWSDWLTADLRDPGLINDAMTPARRMYYMKYVNEDGEPLDWVERLITEHWLEMKRDDFTYRYPLKSNELRSFISDVIKDNLTYRERQVVSMYLGLETGETVSYRRIGEMFSIKPHVVQKIYQGAIGKLKRAITSNPRWRRRGPDGRYT